MLSTGGEGATSDASYHSLHIISTVYRLTEPLQVLLRFFEVPSDRVTQLPVGFLDDVIGNDSVDVCVSSCQP